MVEFIVHSVSACIECILGQLMSHSLLIRGKGGQKCQFKTKTRTAVRLASIEASGRLKKLWTTIAGIYV